MGNCARPCCSALDNIQQQYRTIDHIYDIDEHQMYSQIYENLKAGNFNLQNFQDIMNNSVKNNVEINVVTNGEKPQSVIKVVNFLLSKLGPLAKKSTVNYIQYAQIDEKCKDTDKKHVFIFPSIDPADIPSTKTNGTDIYIVIKKQLFEIPQGTHILVNNNKLLILSRYQN